jgi:hypothetical protein
MAALDALHRAGEKAPEGAGSALARTTTNSSERKAEKRPPVPRQPEGRSVATDPRYELLVTSGTL